MVFLVIIIVIVWIILSIICDKWFSKREIKKEDELIISKKPSFLDGITLIIIYLFLIYTTKNIFMVIGGLFFWIIPGVIILLIDPIIIIRYNDSYIELEHLMGKRCLIKYEDILKVWKDGQRKQLLCILACDKSKIDEDNNVEFSVPRNTISGKNLINKLKEKGIII